MSGAQDNTQGTGGASSPTSDGWRIVETSGARIEIVEPWCAGQHDPPMQEWLRLPVADSCPADDEHRRWGTDNPRGYLHVRRCKTCGSHFRPEVDGYLIESVVSALNGTPRRFILEYLDAPSSSSEASS